MGFMTGPIRVKMKQDQQKIMDVPGEIKIKMALKIILISVLQLPELLNFMVARIQMVMVLWIMKTIVLKKEEVFRIMVVRLLL